eukprot:6462359-Amphidinium_carterae.1
MGTAKPKRNPSRGKPPALNCCVCPRFASAREVFAFAAVRFSVDRGAFQFSTAFRPGRLLPLVHSCAFFGCAAVAAIPVWCQKV